MMSFFYLGEIMYLVLMKRINSVHLYFEGLYLFRERALNAMRREVYRRDGKYEGKIIKIHFFNKRKIHFEISVIPRLENKFYDYQNTEHGIFYIDKKYKRFIK